MSATTALRAARNLRGWRQRDVSKRLIGMLRTRHQDSPDAVVPVLNCLSEWERGLRTVSVTYRDLLCELYGEPPEALGLAEDWSANVPIITRSEIDQGATPQTQPGWLRWRIWPDPVAAGDPVEVGVAA